MSQRAGALGPDIPSKPVAICHSLACSGHGGSMEDQPACRHISPDLAASCKPCTRLGKASYQQTLELLQDLLAMPRRREQEDHSASGSGCPGADVNGAGGPDGGPTKQPASSPTIEADLRRECASRQSPLSLRLADRDHLAACLLLPQVLCKARESEEEEETLLANARLFTAGKHKVSLAGAEEKLPQRDTEAQQQVAKLLLMKQQEVLEARGLVRVMEAEMLQLQQRLRIELRKSAQLIGGFEQICEVLKSKLAATESGSENLAAQLQALLGKYDRLKRRASSTKRSLLREVKEKEQMQRTLEETRREKDELAAEQRLLREQKEAALKELSISTKKLRAAEEQRSEVAREKASLEEEASAMRGEVGRLTQQLSKTQRESKKLAKSARSRDLERAAGLHALQELQETVKRLHAKLEECGSEKQAALDKMEALKQEAKSMHTRQRVELLQLREEHRNCGERAQGLRRESDALAKLVADLKQEKLVLKEEMEAMQQERAEMERSRKGEAERLREAVCGLENERRVLLAEMEVLRQDYVALSDRIARRMTQVEQEDGLASIAEMSQASTEQSKTLEFTRTSDPMVTEDVIAQIRQRLQVEELHSKTN